jgi:predicted nucleotidyltransferase
MDKHELVEVLRTLDERLSSPFDVILIGGAAMIVHFGAGRATRDVDVLVLRGDLTELREAAKAVASECDLPADWISDAAKGFADILPPDFYHRLAPLAFSFRHLRLYALGLPEQVAMKIVALREQDLEDLELLLPQFSEEEKKVLLTIMDHVGRVRPDWAQKIRYFLQEQGWEIA